jgi:type IV pilus assembly protein PilF
MKRNSPRPIGRPIPNLLRSHVMYRNFRLSAVTVLLAAALGGCATPGATKISTPRQLEVTVHDQLPTGPARADQVESAKVNTQLAAAYLQSGRIEAAKEVIARALAADSNSALALAVQGLIYGESRDLVRGDESFRRASEIAPGDPDLNHNFAMYLCRTGRVAISERYFQKAIDTPGYSRALTSETALGGCLLKIGRARDAETRFRHVLTVDRSNPTALLGLAELAIQRRDYVTARDNLARYSSNAMPTPQSLWLSLLLERAAGNKTEAAGLAADLVRLFPTSEQASRLNDEQLSSTKN